MTLTFGQGQGQNRVETEKRKMPLIECPYVMLQISFHYLKGNGITHYTCKFHFSMSNIKGVTRTRNATNVVLDYDFVAISFLDSRTYF